SPVNSSEVFRTFVESRKSDSFYSMIIKNKTSWRKNYMKSNYKSGFIAIIGRPNVGKSTFLNHVIGQKIAIMSDKPQTTRNKIQGVLTTDDYQMVFIDTPGIHKPKHRLGDFMMKIADNTLNEVDAVLFMINADEGYGRGDQFIIDRLENVKSPVFLIINKIDLVSLESLLCIIDEYMQKSDLHEIIPISALQENNVNRLLTELQNYLPEGPLYYPQDQITDHPERFIITEFIREKALHLTREEVPHSIAVALENMERRKDETVFIQATI